MHRNKVVLYKEKASSEGNNDFIEYSEKITNSNLLDTHFINNVGKCKADRLKEDSKLLEKEPSIAVKRTEERK